MKLEIWYFFSCPNVRWGGGINLIFNKHINLNYLKDLLRELYGQLSTGMSDYQVDANPCRRWCSVIIVCYPEHRLEISPYKEGLCKNCLPDSAHLVHRVHFTITGRLFAQIFKTPWVSLMSIYVRHPLNWGLSEHLNLNKVLDCNFTIWPTIDKSGECAALKPSWIFFKVFFTAI